MRVRGLEPPRQRHMILIHARLPFRHTRLCLRGERRDLNPRPLGPQPSALPPELRSPRSPDPAPLHQSEGAPERIRTSDPRIRSPLLYPTELQAHVLSRPPRHSAFERAGDGTRTRDKRLGRPMLYQLSYTRLLSLLLPPGSWSGREDLNLRPPAPKAGALPGCATSRQPHFSGFGRESIAYRPTA